MDQKHRILIIDDSQETLAGLKAFFQEKYETLTAKDGFEGLQALEEHENGIDLVITDMMMPELSGVGVISILRKKYPGIPIIAITGWRGDIEATGHKLDADEVFEKPFQISDLGQSVCRLLAGRGTCSLSGPLAL